MGNKRKGNISIKSGKLGVSDEELDKLMIEEWLKKNKPSVQFKDEPIPHLQQEPTLGTKTSYQGSKL